jgi:hypothetical protein
VSGFFDVQRGVGTLDVIAVQFARPAEGETAAKVADAIRARTGLTLVETTAVTVDGLAGTRLVVDNADPDLQAQRFTPVVALTAGPLSVGSGRRLRIDLFDTPDGVLAILVGGSVRLWEATTASADPVESSVRFRAR